ncbi:MAG TPA: beta-ketoacyl-[acyl-carrier-protein] synthase family protein [Candidatus Sulfotelmatobacter sp.]|nr:beta-ketoacyl-[acyl-carrier-protein] synthase family protein [Candidatus Sulfotelmatobacter sp.]
MRDVAVTGAGLLTPIGHDVATNWDGFRSGRLGIVRAPASTGWHGWWAGVPDAFLDGRLDATTAKRTDRFARYALICADEALRAAGIAQPDAERTAIVLGTSMGGVPALVDARAQLDTQGSAHVPPRLMAYVIPNMAAAALALRYGLHGPQLTIAAACASSIDAIGHGARLIERGDADVALCGGTETLLTPVVAWSLQHAGALSSAPDAARASLPFDVARSGFVMGDGCGVVVLEAGERARARGAPVLGYVRGYGSIADGYHPTSPEPSGRWEARAMELALRDAQVEADAIDAIFAHGTATVVGDAVEIAAIDAIAGGRAVPIPVTSLKGHVGHAMAASGVTSVIVALRGMAEATLVPTLGSTHLDPAARFDLVTGAPRALAMRTVQVNAFGFGGQNASLVLADRP